MVDSRVVFVYFLTLGGARREVGCLLAIHPPIPRKVAEDLTKHLFRLFSQIEIFSQQRRVLLNHSLSFTHHQR